MNYIIMPYSCFGVAMVAVVQLEERKVVILVVAGSSPVSYPQKTLKTTWF